VLEIRRCDPLHTRRQHFRLKLRGNNRKHACLPDLLIICEMPYNGIRKLQKHVLGLIHLSIKVPSARILFAILSNLR